MPRLLHCGACTGIFYIDKPVELYMF